MPYDPTGYVSHEDELHRSQTWKRWCRAATTANITIATALNNGDTLDGVTLATGDRVLVKDQTSGAQNGIYVVGASPARAFDFDQDATTGVPGSEALGAVIEVIAGTVNGGTFWRCSNTTLPVLGTTALTFVQFAAGPSFATPAIILGTAAAAGAASTVIRSDATIVAFDATAPTSSAIGDSAATGSAAKAARRDHLHGREALSTATPLVESGAGAVGTAVTSSREDHVHPAAPATGGAVDHEHIGNIQFNGDGSTTAFELPAAPFDAYSVQAYVAGVRQDVTLSGGLLTTMTFGSAPASGTNNILVDLVAAAA